MRDETKKAATGKAAGHPTVIYTSTGGTAFAVIIPAKPTEPGSDPGKPRER